MQPHSGYAGTHDYLLYSVHEVTKIHFFGRKSGSRAVDSKRFLESNASSILGTLK